MKLKILPEEYLAELPRITTSKIKQGNKFHPDGLFSEQIFGPIQSYRCHCDIPSINYNDGSNVCSKCGIKITSSKSRRQQYAVIEVPSKIINPVALELMLHKPQIKKFISKILLGKQGIIKHIEDNEIDFVNIDLIAMNQIDDNIIIGLDSIPVLIEYLSRKISNSKTINYLMEMIKNNNLFSKYILVIPPSMRPVLNSSDGSQMDQINKYYLSVLAVLEQKIEIVDRRYEALLEMQIQKILMEFYKFIFSSIGKKQGLLRNNMAGKRIDFSGRAVVVTDPEIPFTHIKISRLILLQLYKLEISKELMKNRKFLTFKAANDYLIDIYEKENIPEHIKTIIDQISTDQLVLINRQPSLHRGSLIGFKVIPTDGYIVGINPVVVEPYNLDHDGDQVAIYRPITTRSIREAENNIWSFNNLYSPASGKLQFIAKQDVIYGIYKLSETPEGRKIIEEAIGEKLDNDKIINKKELIRLLSEKSRTNPSILDSIKNIGFAYTLLKPITLSLKDFNPIKCDFTNDMKENLQILEDHNEVLKNSFEKREIINSGARASWEQVRQMITARGYVADFFGNVYPELIKSSLIEGLDQKEFFFSCYGTRKSLLDTAENVASSGYLTRRLVYSSSYEKLDYNIDDCGSTDYLEITVKDKVMANSLLYRYYKLNKNDKNLSYTETIDDCLNLIGKTIFLRSPITCKSEKVCKTCYGGLSDIIRSKYIGFIASQALGEKSTQLVLRTFHTSGVAQGVSGEQEDIIKAISLVEKITDKKLKINNLSELINEMLKLFNIFSEYGDILLVHFEVLFDTMLYLKTDNNIVRWRLNRINDELVYDELYKLSIKTIPSLTSWFLGMIFQSAESNFVKGFLKNNDDVTLLEEIVLGRVRKSN